MTGSEAAGGNASVADKWTKRVWQTETIRKLPGRRKPDYYYLDYLEAQKAKTAAQALPHIRKLLDANRFAEVLKLAMLNDSVGKTARDEIYGRTKRLEEKGEWTLIATIATFFENNGRREVMVNDILNAAKANPQDEVAAHAIKMLKRDGVLKE